MTKRCLQLVVALALLVGGTIIASSPAATAQAADAPRSPSVADLTPWVAPDGEFAVRVALPPEYPGGRLQARVFRAMDDGSEVRSTADPTRRYRWATYTEDIASGAPSVTLRIPLGDGEDGAWRLQLDAGVYPVLLEAFPVEGEPWQALTYLVHLPELAPTSQVALIVPVSAELRWTSATGVEVAPDEVARLGDLATTLAAYPEVPVTLALEPGLLVALAEAPGGPAVRDALAGVGRRGEVLQAPFVDVAAGSWAGTLLAPALVEQFTAGEAALTAFLGRPPDGTSWVVDAGDSPELLQWLAARGVSRYLLTPHVPGGGLAGGDTPLSIAGIAAPHRAYAAATVDAPLPAAGANPVLQANHLLGALSADALAGRLEPKALLAPSPAGGDTQTLRALLQALGAPGLLEGTTTSALPNDASSSVEVPLPPRPSEPTPELVDHISRLRGRVDNFTAAAGDGDPAIAGFRQAALVAGRADIDDGMRARHLAEVEASLQESLAGVEIVDGGALTITSHQARLPVTLRNTSDRTLDVAVVAQSAELTMLGEPGRVTLLPSATEDIEIPFRVSRSGDFLVEVTVLTPDGGFALASAEVTLRSTAVSGVGIVLSVGALAFLGLWWARNLRHRRTAGPPSMTVPNTPAPDARVGEPVP